MKDNDRKHNNMTEAELTRIIMVEFLKLNDSAWLQSEDIDIFLSALNIENLQLKIQVLTSVKNAVRLIPAEIYADESQHVQCINTINNHLDRLIEREEYEC